jgi:hypothetical protein
MRSSKWRRAYEQARSAQQQVERDRHELVRICHHEAAHAAVVFALNVRVKRMSVGFGRLDGSARQQGLVEWDDKGIDLRTRILISFAGPAADLLFYGRELDPCGKDHYDALNAAEKLAAEVGGDMFHIVDYGRARAEEIVRIHADAVVALARALLEAPQHEMSGQAVEDFLVRAGVRRHGPTFGYERRGGVTRPSPNPDPDRRVAVYARRCDGYFA